MARPLPIPIGWVGGGGLLSLGLRGGGSQGGGDAETPERNGEKDETTEEEKAMVVSAAGGPYSQRKFGANVGLFSLLPAWTEPSRPR
jgi:hypothetical protein